MQHLTGTWRGVSTTIPNYLIAEDVLRFNSDGTIDYEAGDSSGKKFRIKYRTKSDGNDLILYPEKGTEEVMRDGYRVTIREIRPNQISLTLGHRVTIYEKEN
jgi:hypothetical protein